MNVTVQLHVTDLPRTELALALARIPGTLGAGSGEAYALFESVDVLGIRPQETLLFIECAKEGVGG